MRGGKQHEKDSPSLSIVNGQIYTSSVDIARHFRKSHQHVLRDIQELRKGEDQSKIGLISSFSRLNFLVSTYADRHGRSQPSFNITRDGFTLLAMGFTGNDALLWKIAYIRAFNEMEAQMRRQHAHDGAIQQLNIFPGLRSEIESHRPTLSIVAATSILIFARLFIPAISRERFIRMIKRKEIEGYRDEKHGWLIYEDSFRRWLKLRRQGLDSDSQRLSA